MIYDVIGDIHGQADKLIGLLLKLGYAHNGKYFAPPKGHKAVFVGDLIDRGPQQIKTLEIVFAMLDAQAAYAVMGNHEYNALAYATVDEIANDGRYLRSHQENHNRQHEAFLAEAPFGSSIHQYWLKRFYELPLWLELDKICVIHACWDVDKMAILTPLLTEKNCLTPQALQATGQKGSDEYEALERLLKGMEMPLPDSISFFDKDKTKRNNIRVQWWKNNLSGQKILDIARGSPSDLSQIPPDMRVGELSFNLKTNKLVFIGHYWLSGSPEPLSQQVACVDYSAAVDKGYLTAYQLDTNAPLVLHKSNFIQFFHDK